MHELALAEGIRELVEEAARRQGAARVRTVVLEIGELAAVEVEALRFCFESVVRGGLAEGARLEVATVPGQGRCLECGRPVPLPRLPGLCPGCGGARLQPTAGTTMRVQAIDIE